MDFGLPFLAENNTATRHMLGLSACGNTPEKDGGHLNAPKTMSTISKDGQLTQGHAMPTYEVTVHAECTATELEGLLVGLANTGTLFTVKIRLKPSKV